MESKIMKKYYEYMKPSAFGYRFSITSNQNNETLGTGVFKSRQKMTKDEQISFFHEYTNRMYLNKEAFVSIDIFEAEELTIDNSLKIS